jgi:hypothetical protein
VSIKGKVVASGKDEESNKSGLYHLISSEFHAVIKVLVRAVGVWLL